MSISALKKRTFQLFEISKGDDFVSKTFDYFIMTLIVLNVTAVIFETVEPIAAQHGQFFADFELFCVIIFTIEYLARIWSCTSDKKWKGWKGRIRYFFTPMALIDLLAILPFYLPFIITVDLRFARVLRLVRLFRIFKLGRYTHSLKTLETVVKKTKEELIVSCSLVILLLIFSAGFMYYIENQAQPEAFSSIPQAMWWASAALSTVGYGDVYPVTIFGQFLGSVIAFLGIIFFALPTGILATGFFEEMQNKQCPHCKKHLKDPIA